MTNTDKLKEQEIKNLTEEEVIDLDQLILNGKDIKTELIINYPLPDGTYTKMGVKVRPVSSNEWNKILLKVQRSKGKLDMPSEVFKVALFKLDETPYPKELITDIPAGIANEIFEKICDLSGIKEDKEETERFAKELMGF